MTFDDRILAFAGRFLSARTVRCIVEPAVADLQYEESTCARHDARQRLAVLRAVCGGICDDLARASAGMLMMTLVPASYYTLLLVICFDVSSLEISRDFMTVAVLIFVLSFGPVIACFWPDRASTE